MNRYYLFLMSVVVGISCRDTNTTSKPFTGPDFQLQSYVGTSEWQYDDTLQSFDFFQAKEAASYLYSVVDPGFTISTLVRIPVRGGGLKISYSDTLVTVLAYPDKVSWQLNDQIDFMPVSVEDYPLELRAEVDDDQVRVFVKLKHQSTIELGKLKVQLDSVEAGLFLHGYGGYNFENVQIRKFSNFGDDPSLTNSLEIYHLSSMKTQQCVYSSSPISHVDWSPNGKHIYYAKAGKLEKLNLATGKSNTISVADVTSVLSGSPDPQNEELAITAFRNDHTQVYFLPIQGGNPELKTVFAPSYFSDWSPDGEWLIYSGARKGKQLDIYKLSRRWGREDRLTTHDSLDGGAVYGAQHMHIYFHSDRTGSMKIWKMNLEGDGVGQVTHDDEWDDWFPQPSPDGRWLLVHSRHRTNLDETTLRLFNMENLTLPPRILVTYIGDVSLPVLNCWSEDSDRIVYISSLKRK